MKNETKLTLHAPHPQRPKENPCFFIRLAMSSTNLTIMGQKTQKIVMNALLGWPFLLRISICELNQNFDRYQILNLLEIIKRLSDISAYVYNVHAQTENHKHDLVFESLQF